MDNDSLIHLGHRERMRDKLALHGARIFDTYELLEMLLYGAIPYKDTNPTAKRLLMKFGSLCAVLAADKAELMTVQGVGERAAELIRLAGRYTEALGYLPEEDSSPEFDSFHFCGRYLVKFFEENESETVAVLLLDNGMRMLSLETIPCKHFGTAAVKPSFFLDAVARTGAGNVIISCNHRYGALYMTDSELASYKSVKMALDDIRVPIAASYIVSGKRYTRIGADLRMTFSSPSAEYSRFIDSIREGVFTVEE